MKKVYTIVSLFLILTIIFTINPIISVAASNDDYKTVWRETRTYPLSMDEIENMRIGLVDSIDILNPPEDILKDYSTEELACLMMDYPLLWLLTSYDYSDKDIFWGLIQSSRIYKELMNREEGILCLVSEYGNRYFDPDKYYEGCGYAHSGDVYSEIFGCQFIVYYWDQMNDKEKDKCLEIISNKEKVYDDVESSFYSLYLSFGDKDNSPQEGSCADLLTIGTSSGSSMNRGFTATGSSRYLSIEGVNISFTPGIYSKYSVNANCEKWASGDYDSATKALLDNKIWTSWTMECSSTPKFNCHSYAWIYSGRTNEYWLPSPVAYMNSSDVIYKGYNITPAVNDIVVLYNRYTGNIVHSVRISSAPTGTTGIYTISKFGGCPLASAPLSDVMMYYQSDNYSVYRTY